MRRLFSLIVLLALATLRLDAAPMTDGERQRLLAHLDMTESWLISEVAGLSDDQLRFRRAPDTWNIMDVVEHLAIAEPQYWKHLQDSTKQPETTDKAEATDAGILWYGIDRTEHQKTGEARVPKGRWNSIKDSLGEFRKLRATMRDYATTTQDGLRSAPPDRRQHGRLSMVPDDLDALAAAHPADPRDQGRFPFPGEGAGEAGRQHERAVGGRSRGAAFGRGGRAPSEGHARVARARGACFAREGSRSP